MTHADAQREMAVEKYLLDELHGATRDQFEDHLFDCALCAADLQAGTEFVEGISHSGAKVVAMPARVTAQPVSTAPAWSPARNSARSPAWNVKAGTWAASLFTPWIAGPALAACLLLLLVQSFVMAPRLRRELAQTDMPAVVSELSLKGGATRGPGHNEVFAHPGGRFLLSLDIPSDARFREYRCTLVSPEGKAVWHTYLSSSQVNDTVVIDVPVGSTAAGVNVLKVEGIPQQGGREAGVTISERSFTLKIGE